MATPENGTLTFNTKPDKSGQGLSLSFYSSDVPGAAATLSLSSIAGSGDQTFFTMPATMYLVDVSLTTGQTVTVGYSVNVFDVPTGNMISVANSINTIATRPNPAILIPKGAKFTLIQK